MVDRAFAWLARRGRLKKELTIFLRSRACQARVCSAVPHAGNSPGTGDDMRQDDRSGLVFALCGFALLSLGDAVVKTMAGEWPPTAIAALRYVLGAAGLPLYWFMRRRQPAEVS